MQIDQQQQQQKQIDDWNNNYKRDSDSERGRLCENQRVLVVGASRQI